MTRKCHVRFVRELSSVMGSAYLPNLHGRFRGGWPSKGAPPTRREDVPHRLVRDPPEVSVRLREQSQGRLSSIDSEEKRPPSPEHTAERIALAPPAIFPEAVAEPHRRDEPVYRTAENAPLKVKTPGHFCRPREVYRAFDQNQRLVNPLLF